VVCRLASSLGFDVVEHKSLIYFFDLSETGNQTLGGVFDPWIVVFLSVYVSFTAFVMFRSETHPPLPPLFFL